MEKVKQFKYIIILVLVILGFVFYWYSWRPSNIVKACADRYLRVLSDDRGDKEYVYKMCLLEMGLSQ